MKKVFLLLLALFPFSVIFAQDYTVEKFTVDIYLNQKGYFDVVEKYDVHFNTNKHGIFRTIQTKYKLLNSDGEEETRKIKISKVKVPGHKFDVPLNFVQDLSSFMEIKIGNKNKTVTGNQHYEIKYRVKNAFLFEDSLIRFYWNLKTDGWSGDFKKIRFRVYAPNGIEFNQSNTFLYSGTSGISEQSADFSLSYEGNILKGKSKKDIISRPQGSVTILLNLPPNSIQEIIPKFPFLSQYGWLSCIIAMLVFFYLVWRKHGKDDSVITAISYYPPKGIDPAMAGFLINDKEDSTDLIAFIPYWGSKGYISIEEIPKKGIFVPSDVKLKKLKPLAEDAPIYEQTIFTALFTKVPEVKTLIELITQIGSKTDKETPPLPSETEVLISSLKNSFYISMNLSKKSLEEAAQKYYVAESKKVQNKMAIALVLLIFVLGIPVLLIWGVIAAIAIAVTSIILLAMNFFMIKKNKKGNEVFSELKGFKKFIEVAEEAKLKMLLKTDPAYFETTMAYALAFGLFDQWAKKFDSLDMQPPNWYNSSTTGMLAMGNFSKSFSSTITSMKSTMVSSPSSSSSGGGSSGGGFGGGGGGSW